MNKGHKFKKLGRNRSQRRALLKSLANDLIIHGRITTTEAKAKAVQPFAERMITHAKKGTVASRRHVNAYLSDAATKKLFDELASNYKDRQGGYTRIVKAPIRKSDVSKMAIIELV